MDRGGLAARAVGAARRRHRLAGPPPRRLSRLALTERATGPEFGFRGPEQQLADAWTAVASRQPMDAAELFRSAAAQAASTGHRVTESWTWHDLARTSGEDASARLRELAETCDSPLVSARARHAAAASARDARELAGAAETMLEGAASARPIGT